MLLPVDPGQIHVDLLGTFGRNRSILVHFMSVNLRGY